MFYIFEFLFNLFKDKYIYKMRNLILFALLFMFSCSTPDFNEDKNRIAKTVLNKHIEIQNRVIITEEDTIRIDKFNLDYISIGSFNFKEFSGKEYLWLNETRFESDSFTYYFNSLESSFIEKQINDSTNVDWSLELENFEFFTDSSLQSYHFEKDYELNIWSLIDTETTNYLTLTKPLINSKGTKAIIGTNLFLSNHHLETLFILSLENENWTIQDSRTKVLRFKCEKLIDNEKSNELIKEYTNGEIEEADESMKICYKIYAGIIEL